MILKRLWIFLLILLTTGCAGGQPAKKTLYYMLNYAPPVFKVDKTLNDILRLERFSVDQSFNNNSMWSRTGSFSLQAIPYDRWRANPADMVTDSLIRDFRRAGLFRAIFSYHELERTRFVLQGNVTEFLELQRDGDSAALLSLSVSLLDLEREDVASQVVFQKNYSQASKLPGKGPEALAQGLSESMRLLSGQIMGDVYQALTSPAR